MTIEEQIKILCVLSHITISELARRLEYTPQNFNAKLKREGFSVPELQKIAEVLDCTFEYAFITKNGRQIDTNLYKSVP